MSVDTREWDRLHEELRQQQVKYEATLEEARSIMRYALVTGEVPRNSISNFIERHREEEVCQVCGASMERPTYAEEQVATAAFWALTEHFPDDTLRDPAVRDILAKLKEAR